MMVFHRSGAVPIPTELAPEISSCCATVHPSGNGHDHTLYIFIYIMIMIIDYDYHHDYHY